MDYLQKGTQKVNNQYRFVSHDQVTAEIHSLQVKHKFLIIPTVKEVKQDGNRTEVMIVCHFVNIDEPTDQYRIEFPGYGIDPSDKGVGKAISYAYKYAMLKAFSLETGDDPDQDQKAIYEAPKCLEFETVLLPYMHDYKWEQMDIFVAECAESMSKAKEDVKREALKRIPDFFKAFEKWVERK